MTAAEVKNEMKRVYWIKKEIAARVKRMEELRSMAEKTTQTFSHVPTAQSNGSRVENYAIMLVEMMMDLEERTNELIAIEKKVEGWINTVADPRVRSLLIDYHLNGLSVERISEQEHYSARWVFKLLASGYEEISVHINSV